MNTFSEATFTVDHIITDFEAEMQKVQAKLKVEMKEVFKKFFDAHPTVKTIHWTQYTPHFNDGDECVFSVGELYFTASEIQDLNEREHSYGEGDDLIIDQYDEIDPKLKADMNSLERMTSSDVVHDVLKAMFGDHVWVLVNREDFEIRDYDHD